jgi:hypothetical protein
MARRAQPPPRRHLARRPTSGGQAAQELTNFDQGSRTNNKPVRDTPTRTACGPATREDQRRLKHQPDRTAASRHLTQSRLQIKNPTKRINRYYSAADPKRVPKGYIRNGFGEVPSVETGHDKRQMSTEDGEARVPAIPWRSDQETRLLSAAGPSGRWRPDMPMTMRRRLYSLWMPQPMRIMAK